MSFLVKNMTFVFIAFNIKEKMRKNENLKPKSH